MTEWQAFVKNQMRLGGHDIPQTKLVCIDIPALAEFPKLRQVGAFDGGFVDLLSHGCVVPRWSITCGPPRTLPHTSAAFVTSELPQE